MSTRIEYGVSDPLIADETLTHAFCHRAAEHELAALLAGFPAAFVFVACCLFSERTVAMAKVVFPGAVVNIAVLECLVPLAAAQALLEMPVISVAVEVDAAAVPVVKALAEGTGVVA